VGEVPLWKTYCRQICPIPVMPFHSGILFFIQRKDRANMSKKNRKAQVLFPLKKQYEAADIEVLERDRSCLERLAQAILADDRLAGMIVIAWLRNKEMEMVPNGYVEAMTGIHC
jgi:hypothetical protein